MPKDKPVWEKKDPTKTDKPLTKGQKSSAKAKAKAAGRPYPNLVDNMAAAKKKKKTQWLKKRKTHD